MVDKICLAISGTHGSGTSTTAKKIADELGLRFVSAGTIFRQSAKERGIDISEFTQIVEGDPYLKDQLDQQMRDEAEKGNVVVEGRIACWVADEYTTLKVMLDAPLDIRIARISKRDEKSKSLVASETLQREKEAHDWFLKSYSIDLSDVSIYDIIINTSRLQSEKVVEIIKTGLLK